MTASQFFYVTYTHKVQCSIFFKKGCLFNGEATEACRQKSAGQNGTGTKACKTKEHKTNGCNKKERKSIRITRIVIFHNTLYPCKFSIMDFRVK